MRIRKEGDDICMADIKSPPTPIAIFNDALDEQSKSHFQNEHNCGLDMLLAFGGSEVSRHEKISLDDAVELINKLKSIYSTYEYERMVIRKRGK